MDIIDVMVKKEKAFRKLSPRSYIKALVHVSALCMHAVVYIPLVPSWISLLLLSLLLLLLLLFLCYVHILAPSLLLSYYYHYSHYYL